MNPLSPKQILRNLEHGYFMTHQEQAEAAAYIRQLQQAVLDEREACAELATQKAKHIFDQAEIYAVGASETANAQATAWQLKVLADEIRARGEI